MDSRQLFEDFCFYRQYTAHYQQKQRYHKGIPLSAEKHLKLFDKMIDWCKTRQINPRHWLYSLFATRRWIFAPKLQECFLMSERHIKKFRKFRDYAFYKRYRASQTPTQTRFDPNRDLSAASEQAKNYYVVRGQLALCMARMQQETFGYHPRSTICIRCVASQQCRALLEAHAGFDIVGLRARTQEACQGRGYAR